MCGLVGILRVHASGSVVPAPLDAIPEARLDQLDDSIAHRGPDGHGRFRDRVRRDDGAVVDVALVHRRLAILDPEGGRQPMVHDGVGLRHDLTYRRGETPIVASEVLDAAEPLTALVFNGCLYNHHDLRAELEPLGARFETDHADTEALLHAYRAWGVTFASKLDGMFAFTLWDRSRADIVMARDRAGEKPLYSSRDESAGVFVFASCAPGVASAGARSEVQRGGVVSALYHGWAEAAAIAGIEAQREPAWLAGGEPVNDPDAVGETEDDQAHWWPWSYTERRDTPLTTGDAERLLRESVHERLEADVPLAVFLSGGIDSGLVAAFARERRPDLTTLTVRMPDPRYDESEAAAETAAHLGTRHLTLDCDARPADDLVRLIHQLGGPFADSSLLPTYWLCRATREVAGVALSGDGGDELFGGYQRYAGWRALGRWGGLARWLPAWPIPQRDPKARSTKAARFISAAKARGYFDLRAVFPSQDLSRLLGERVGLRGPRSSLPHDPLFEDFQHYLPHDLMRKTDTASMSVALEVRAPFLARAVVDRALAAPLDDLMPNGERKGLLKAIARRRLPGAIVDRPKMGFAIPVGAWFRTDFGGMRTLLLDHLKAAEPFPGVTETGLTIDRRAVDRLLREHDDAGGTSVWPWKGRDHAQRLYALLVLSIWAHWLKDGSGHVTASARNT